MSALTWNLAAGVAKEIIPADEYRDEIVVQLYSAEFTKAVNPVYVAFNETPVIGNGICLGNQGHSVRVLGAKARLAVNAICAGTATGGIETDTSIEYRHTPNWPGWWNDNDNPEYPKWPEKS
jgi:hypothetical protein